MARNPFYPGYYPDKQNQAPSNPMYPGYYPGRKVPSKPRPKGPYPSHFTGFGTGDTVSEFLDGFSTEVEGTLRGPDRWVRERLADDFKQSLKINALPPQGVSPEALDDFETGSVPGGGFISLNIDPRDWLGIAQPGKKVFNEDGTLRRDKEAPRKMLKKTLTGWAKSAMEFKDLETHARTQFWGQLLKGSYDPAEHTTLENSAYEAITGVPPVKGAANPLSLSETGIVLTTTLDKTSGHATQSVVVKPKAAWGLGTQPLIVSFDSSGAPATINPADAPSFGRFQFGHDLFRETGENLKQFYRGAISPVVRDKKYDLFMGKAINSFYWEAKAKREIIRQNPSLRSTITIDPDVDSILERADFASTLSGLGVAQNKAVIALKNSESGNFTLGHLNNVKSNLKTINDNFTQLDIKYSSPLFKASIIKKHGAAYAKDLETYMTNMRALVSSSDFVAITSSTVPYAGASSQVNKILAGLNTSSGSWNTFVKGRTVTGGDLAKNGLERQLFIDIGGELSSNKKIRDFINDNELEGSQKLLTHIPRASFERALEMFDEGLSKFQSGFLEAYGWTPRLGKLSDVSVSYFSAKHWIQKGLYRVHNFGLVLPEDDEMLNKGFKFNNKVAPGRLFGNNFSISVDITQTKVPSKIKVKTWGGDHYKAVTDLNNWMEISKKSGAEITKQQMKEMLVNKKKFFHKDFNNTTHLSSLNIVTNTKGQVTNVMFFDNHQWKDLTNPEFNSLMAWDTCRTREDVLGRIEEITTLQKKIDKFIEFVELNIMKPLKKLGVNTDNIDVWYNLVNKLHDASKNGLINQRYLGAMQRLSIINNKFQEVLGKIPGVGYVTKQINGAKALFEQAMNQIRIVITETIQKMATSLTTTATRLGLKTALGSVLQSIALATDAFAPLIGHLIAWVITVLITWIIKRVWGTIKGGLEFGQRLMKGELTDYLEEAEKKQDKKVRKILLIVLILILINTFFSSITSLVIPELISIGGSLTADPFSDAIPFTLSTFSPTDPTRKWGSIQQGYDWNINLEYYQPGEGIPPTGVGMSCGGLAKRLPSEVHYPDAFTEKILGHAYDIGEDLIPGFWSYWNHSPTLYPWAWNQEAYDRDPNNADTTTMMFWCTFMVIFSEQKSIPDFPDAWITQNMLNRLLANPTSGGFKVLPRPQATLGSIKPGSIIWFSNNPTDSLPLDTKHVALVYSVTPTGINTIESNNCYVSVYIPAETCGPNLANCPLSNGPKYNPITAVGLIKYGQ
jgi:hypothetical protein